MPMSWFAASARWIKLDSAGSSKLRHHATSTAPETSPAAGSPKLVGNCDAGGDGWT